MNPASITVMVATGLIALVGLAAAANAHDAALYFFGLVMFVFGVLMNFFMLKRHFDDADARASH